MKAFHGNAALKDDLKKLIEHLFEALPREEALGFDNTWPEYIAVGADLSMVTTSFKLWLMENIKKYTESSHILKLINNAETLLRQRLSGDEPTEEEEKECEVVKEAACKEARIAYAASRHSESLEVQRKEKTDAIIAEAVAYSLMTLINSPTWTAQAVARVAAWTVTLEETRAVWAAEIKNQAYHLLKLLRESV